MERTLTKLSTLFFPRDALGRTHYNTNELIVLYVAWLALFFYVLASAWVAEDAYITFRVIDNFHNGYGLRWNVFERVQAYTHPLWMLLHIPLYAVWHNLFLVSIFLSIACSVGAAAVALATSCKPVVVTLCIFFLPLMLSKSFMDYTTSGLENPLSFLLFAVFGYVVIKKNTHPYFWFYASLSLALALLNRLDTIIFYAPAMAYLAYARMNTIRWRQIAVGFMPLIFWFYFSLFYYGFLFPNTKYAKLDTGMGMELYITQGLHYVQYLVVKDTPGAVLILSSLFFIAQKKRFKNAVPGLPYLPAFIALGIVIDCIYVIYVGGDYMMGRFWSIPIFASVWLWYVFCPYRIKPDMIAAVFCALLTAAAVPPLLQSIRSSCNICIPLVGKVLDASHTFGSNKLFTQLYPPQIRRQGRYVFAEDGKKLALEDPPPVKPLYFIGMPGFYAGHRVTIIDMLGLADPLLARLPASKKQGFYIGHFRRDVPRGYEYALLSGSLDAMPEPLAKYYEKLQLITEGDLLDPERLRTIVLFNLGYYDFWKQQYLNNNGL